MNKSQPITLRRMAGFTLVEAVIVIVITGILAGIVAVFIARPVQGYIDTVRRAELTDAADTALRRIARDVRTALPNSLREPSPASNSCFEFLPTVGGGRYRAAQSSAGAGDILDFSKSDTSFDFLANDNLTTAMFTGTYHAVIYNLRIAGADAYAGDNRAQIDPSSTSTATSGHIFLTGAGKQFPFESPGKRFQVIPNFSVAYSCVGGTNGTLYRQTQAISGSKIACPTTGTALVGNVDCTQTTFNYTPAVSQRDGLLTLTLTLTQSGESVRLYDEVHVNNVP